MKRVRLESAGFMRPNHPELKELVGEACHALARLDTRRLEELELCCQALNRAMMPPNPALMANRARQARDAAGEMAVFARIIDATRANLNVMKRLRELRTRHLEYGGEQTQYWTNSESGNGNH